MVILFLLLTVLLTWFAVFRFRRWRMYKLASLIPGLKGELPVIGNAYSFTGTTEDIMNSLQRSSYESMEHDGIVKIWLNHILYIMLVNPKDIEMVAKTCLEKDDLHRFLKTVTGNGSIFAPVSIWFKRRKITVRLFTSRILETFVDIFSNNSKVMTDNLMTKIGKGSFSIMPYVSRYTFNSAGETATGVKINSQGNPNEPLLYAMNKLMRLVCERIFHLWLHPVWLYKLSPQHIEYKRHIKVVNDFLDTVIKNKRQELKNQKICETEPSRPFDLSTYQQRFFLDSLISLSGGHKGFTDIELREEIMVIITAGTDTSAISLGYTLQLLGKYPLIQDKVYKELREVFCDSDRPLKKEDFPKLKYLERVIKESLRLFPPVPFIVRKVMVETKLPSGRILPAGSGAVISIWGAHRDPKYWGPDAEMFDPDRFLPERFNLQHSCSYMPFSNGPRDCIGYQYAMMSIKTGLSAILRRYRVVLEPEPSRVPRIRVKLDVMMKAVDDQIALERREPLL